jgi:excisionase family DNA binding protein
MAEQPQLLTIRDIAQVLNVSEGTVRNLVKKGELPRARKVNGRLARWHRADVEAYLAKLRWGEG